MCRIRITILLTRQLGACGRTGASVLHLVVRIPSSLVSDRAVATFVSDTRKNRNRVSLRHPVQQINTTVSLIRMVLNGALWSCSGVRTEVSILQTMTVFGILSRLPVQLALTRRLLSKITLILTTSSNI